MVTEREREREKLINNDIQITGNCVYLHDYYNSNVNLHNFKQADVGDFLGWMCKIGHFLYFSWANVSALSSKGYYVVCEARNCRIKV